MKPHLWIVALFWTGLVRLCAAQGVEVPHIFGDHMVIQAGQPVPVWGWAQPGEAVSLRFAGQERQATADAEGRWEVRLDSLASSNAPAELTITAQGVTRVISDVLVGEAWLCSGQSNMEKPLGEQRGQRPVFDAEQEIAAANFPQIRLFKVAKKRSSTPSRDLVGEWVACSPESIDRIKFSAAGYFFGRKLFNELAVPVGLIDSTWGGTRIEVWTPKVGFAAVASLSAFAAACDVPGTKVEGSEPSTLYNAMINPVVPFALRGILWYQGETNIIDGDDGPAYLAKMEAFVRGWRAAWNRELPIYFVQVAPHLYHVVRPASVVSPEATPRLGEAQAAAQKRFPRMGMVVTTDLVDDLMDIHPRNKKDVGERLARWALANDYGQTAIEVSGPVFRTMEIQGARAVLRFEHVTGGLLSSDGKPLTWFTIAGSDGRFYPAVATIENDAIVVTSPKVTAPTVVHFAWDEAARPNLANGAGLPAVPFRTDSAFSPQP